MRIRQCDPSQRGYGLTTQQMRAAPAGAIYVWPTAASLGYARALAQHLGRDDLEIVPPSILDQGGRRLRGRRISGLVLDHACDPNGAEHELLHEIRATCIERFSPEAPREP